MTAAVADPPVFLRAMEASDLAFVLETSMKVRKPHGVAWVDWRDDTADATRAALLTAPGVTVAVLEADGIIVGFSHWIGGVLRMLYVKRDLRGFGYGMQLLGANAGAVLTVHRPNPCWRRWAHVRALQWREP